MTSAERLTQMKKTFPEQMMVPGGEMQCARHRQNHHLFGKNFSGLINYGYKVMQGGFLNIN
jgi:hypothetical protein